MHTARLELVQKRGRLSARGAVVQRHVAAFQRAAGNQSADRGDAAARREEQRRRVGVRGRLRLVEGRRASVVRARDWWMAIPRVKT